MALLESTAITQANSRSEQPNPPTDLKSVEILSTIFGYLKSEESIVENSVPNSLALNASFQAKCLNETVLIDDSGFVRRKYMILGEQVTTVSEIKTTTFLGACGGLMSKLQIDYSNRSFFDDSDDFGKMERAIAHDCADSLTEIEFLCFDSHTFNSIDKSFATVTTVSIVDGYIEHCLSKLSQWFPNIEHLVLTNNTFSNPNHIEATFPGLKQLTLEHNRSDQLGQLTRTSIANCLRLNAGLQSLYLQASSIAMDTQMLKCINDALPGLMELTFELLGKENIANDLTIDFKSLKILTVYLPEKRQCQVPLSAENIEELSLIGYTATNVQWTQFITKCTKLVQLMLLPSFAVIASESTTMVKPIGKEAQNEDVQQSLQKCTLEEKEMSKEKLVSTQYLDEILMTFAKSLPNLTVLHVCADFISTPNHLSRFVDACETLHTLDLGFRYSDQTVRESFATILGSDWETVIQEPQIDYKRITLKY